MAQGRPRTTPDVERMCLSCGAAFTVREYERRKYCSVECAREGKKRPYERDKIATCVGCGTEFACATNAAKYCSDRCRQRIGYMRDPERARIAIKAWERRHPMLVREYQYEWRRRKRARTLAELSEAQQGACYLCRSPLDLESDSRSIHIDHDHRCCAKHPGCGTCTRGLACGRCNRLLGMAADDPLILRRIADNLEAAKERVARQMAAAQQESA